MQPADVQCHGRRHRRQHLLRLQRRRAETIRRSSIGQNRSTARTPKRNGRATSVLTSCRNSRTRSAASCRTATNRPCRTTPVARELQSGEVDENPRASQFPPYVMATERERDNPRAQISRRILHSEAQFDYDEWTRDGFNTKILEAELRIPDLVKEWEALSSKEPDRAAKLKEPVELLKGWDCVSAVDSVAMTLFAETYDRVLKMIAKRDLANYPRIRALEATLADLEKTQGTLESGLGRDQSSAANPRLADRHARPRCVSRRSAEFAHRRRTGAAGRRLQFLHAASTGPEAPLRRRRPFLRRGRRAGGAAEGEDDSSVRRIGRSRLRLTGSTRLRCTRRSSSSHRGTRRPTSRPTASATTIRESTPQRAPGGTER